MLVSIDPFRSEWALPPPLLEKPLASPPSHLSVTFICPLQFLFTSRLPFGPPPPPPHPPSSPAPSTLIQTDLLTHLSCLLLRTSLNPREKIDSCQKPRNIRRFENIELMLQQRQRMILFFFLALIMKYIFCKHGQCTFFQQCYEVTLCSLRTTKKRKKKKRICNHLNRTIQVMSLTCVFRLLQDSCTTADEFNEICQS